MTSLKMTKNRIVIFIVNLILFVVYIFPSGIINKYITIQLEKFVFFIGIAIMYVITIKKMSKKEILFILLILFFTALTGKIEFILFISLPFLIKLVKYKRLIKSYLKKTNLLYICFIMTIFYSIIYNIGDGRMAYSAIREINQSGLAIFCLACLLMNKNKFLAIITYILGFLTLSRSYCLAVVCIVFFRLPFIKNTLKKIDLKMFNFLNLTIISSLFLYLLGVFYIYQYESGNIVDSIGLESKLTLLDMSNFFRFFAIYVTIKIFKYRPLKLFTGVSEAEYTKYLQEIGNTKNVSFRYTPPHNLFFSHLKIYGIFAVFEIIYVSNILKKLVNIDNFGFYVAIFLYTIILGAGLYSYWLYLTIFVLLVFDKNVKENI